MTVGIGEDHELLVGVVGAVEEEARAKLERTLLLRGQVPVVGHRQIEVELLGDGVVGPGRRRQGCHLLERDLRRPRRVDDDQPVSAPDVVVAGRRRLVPGAVLEPQQLSVELGQRAGIGGVEHDLAQRRVIAQGMNSSR